MGPQLDPSHYIVQGILYGDETKGAIVDYLVESRKVEEVVRFNGGPQAGHNVITPEGRHHTFSQVGSGTFAGARTFISRFMLFDPLALIPEIQHMEALGLKDIWSRMTVDRLALLVTPYHVAANRLWELSRGAGVHGSCGMGVGEARKFALDFPEDAPVVGDLEDIGRLLPLKLRAVQLAKQNDLRAVRDLIPDSDVAQRAWAMLNRDPQVTARLYQGLERRIQIVRSDYLASRLRRGTVVFEGAQGMLLHEDFGFHPFTTWTDTSFHNALVLLNEAGVAAETVERIGVLRTYTTRHGAGPFVTEDRNLSFDEPHNRLGTWQGGFRTGHLDLVAARYALEAMEGASCLALSHMDLLPNLPKLCVGYDMPDKSFLHDPSRLRVNRDRDLVYQGKLTEALLQTKPIYAPLQPTLLAERIEASLNTPIRYLSNTPTRLGKWERRDNRTRTSTRGSIYEHRV